MKEQETPGETAAYLVPTFIGNGGAHKIQVRSPAEALCRVPLSSPPQHLSVPLVL